MADPARFGVAIGEELLEEFDKLIARRGYTNRSEALRDPRGDHIYGSRPSRS